MKNIVLLRLLVFVAGLIVTIPMCGMQKQIRRRSKSVGSNVSLLNDQHCLEQQYQQQKAECEKLKKLAEQTTEDCVQILSEEFQSSEAIRKILVDSNNKKATEIASLNARILSNDQTV